jgi:hypothetical protein
MLPGRVLKCGRMIVVTGSGTFPWMNFPLARFAATPIDWH